MEQINSAEAKRIYKQIKGGMKKSYNEEKHCAMVIEVMSNPQRASISSFCVEAEISDTTFYKWLAKHEVFRECYRYGCMISQHNWEQQGQANMVYDPQQEAFNIGVWQTLGAARYGVGKSNRIRVHVDADQTPYDQFKQIMSQASNGDFTSGELKQLCESVNIGLRAYEIVELQKDIDGMKESLRRMEANNAHDSISIASTEKTD